MVNLLNKCLVFIGVLLIISSCAVNNDVISENRFQKRKYQPGFHKQKNSKLLKQEPDVRNFDGNTLQTLEFNRQLVLVESDNQTTCKPDLAGERLTVRQPEAHHVARPTSAEKNRHDQDISIDSDVPNDEVPIDKYAVNVYGIAGFACLLGALINTLVMFSGVGLMLYLFAILLGALGLGKKQRYKRYTILAQIALYGALIALGIALLLALLIIGILLGSLPLVLLGLAVFIVVLFIIF